MIKNFIIMTFIELPLPPFDHGTAYQIGCINLSVNLIYFAALCRDDHFGYSAYMFKSHMIDCISHAVGCSIALNF